MGVFRIYPPQCLPSLELEEEHRVGHTHGGVGECRDSAKDKSPAVLWSMKAFDIGTGIFSHCPFTSETAWAV